MSYQSPFSTRYASDEMRALWSEETKRLTWRRIWLAVAEAQAAAGLVTGEQIDEIRSMVDAVDVRRAAEIEAATGHDLVAELRTFAEQCPAGGRILHWGLTSADVQDNADVTRQRAGLTVLLVRLHDLLLAFADQITATADFPVMGYTHLQPAEPTTLGYRLAVYAQDLMTHFDLLARLRLELRGKGIKGAVGTSAPFTEMLKDSPISPETLEATAMQSLGLDPFPITGQTYPRVQDYLLLSSLSGLACSLHKFAFDLRLLQSPGFSTAREPFGEDQVGSSAMPFKQNPIKAEKICSLARLVAAGVQVAWQNAAVNLLERTLDDSANRRSLIPEAFLACDEMLLTAIEIVRGLIVDRDSSAAWIKVYGPFAATERILTALVQAGADRQAMYERLRQHSLQAWEGLRQVGVNTLADRVASDTTILRYLQPSRVRELMDVSTYLGLAPARSQELAAQIRERFQVPPQGP